MEAFDIVYNRIHLGMRRIKTCVYSLQEVGNKLGQEQDHSHQYKFVLSNEEKDSAILDNCIFFDVLKI